jgi:cytoskeletal protein RodZ
MSENLDRSEVETHGVKAMNKKPVDWVSVILSVIASVLIIVGIYFLQQSIPLTQQVAKSSSSSSVSQSQTSVSSVSSSSSESISSISSSSITAPVPTPTPIPVATTPVFDPINAPLKTGFTNAEIILAVDIANGTNVGGVTEQTGFAGTRWFTKPSVRWNSFDATAFVPQATVGDRWRLELTITDSQQDGAILAPGAITVVKAYKL